MEGALLHSFPFPSDTILVSLGYMYRIPRGIYERYPTINVHPGGLPELAGRHPQIRALADLKRESTSVVLHQITSDRYDEGPILLQVEVKITEADRDDPLYFMERTRQIGVHLVAAYLIGKGAELVEL